MLIWTGPLLLLLLLLQVWVSDDEVSRIASHLNIPESRFLQVYAQKYTKRKGWYLLKDVYNNSSKVRTVQAGGLVRGYLTEVS